MSKNNFCLFKKKSEKKRKKKENKFKTIIIPNSRPTAYVNNIIRELVTISIFEPLNQKQKDVIYKINGENLEKARKRLRL